MKTCYGLFCMTTIKITGMTFVIYPSEIEKNIKVSDLVPYISAGIGMFDSNSLSYNFRLSVNRTYPPVNDLYDTKDALCMAFLDALHNDNQHP